MGYYKRLMIEAMQPKEEPPMEVLLPRGHGMTITPQPWIPVSERLPEEGVEVLGYQSWIPNAHWGYGWFTCVRRDGAWRESYEPDELPNITHWMPLPEPPG